MHFSTLVGLAASIVSAQAVSSGFNYGATLSDGSTAQDEAGYEALFARAKTLQGTDGEFTSARLYTMIQGGTTDDPSSAFQAAINTKTSLLLGIWCSAGQDIVTNELNALKSAIQQYGDKFTSLVVGISVGSEDLYRVSPTGIENDSGAGATPDELVSYIKQTKSAISGTSLSGASIGHVDTWTAWVNSSNSAVTDNIDWLGVDSYPYFETTVANSIQDGNKTFWDSYDQTVSASQGKPVWVTETGWPVSGKVSGQAVASTQNAETYWQEVGCALFGKYNTWWYTIQDDVPTTPNPSFGIIGQNVQSAPLYDLKCKPQKASSSSTKTKSAGGKAGSTGKPVHGTNSTMSTGHHTAGGSGSGNGASASGGPAGHSPTAQSPTAAQSSSAAGATQSGNSASKSGSAIGAGILAIFGLVAAL